MKKKPEKKFKGPGPMRLLCGSAVAYWLSGIVNPAFIAVAVMILLFFPVFFLDFLFPEEPPPQTEEDKAEGDQKEDSDEASIR